MKKFFILCGMLLFFSTGCLKKEAQTQGGNEVSQDKTSLVLYFSATNTTEKVAKLLQEVTDSNLMEIVPEVAYTQADLNYHEKNSRANQEQNDASARPKIKNKISIEQYDTIYLGYPIWWGTNPKIILTLLDSVDFSGKNVILFCTSGSSGIEQSKEELQAYEPNMHLLGAKRLEASVTKEALKTWVSSFSNNFKEKMYFQINGHTLTVTLEDNSSAKALLEKLNQGDISLSMSDYGNFEKVGNLGFSLPTNDHQITTEPGDVILYQGNSITIYYDTNTWNFTKLGKIENMSQQELKSILGEGDISVVMTK